MESNVPDRTGGGFRPAGVTRAFQPSVSARPEQVSPRPALRLAAPDGGSEGPGGVPEADAAGPCPEAMDLRRRRTRDFAEFMLRLSEWLSARDRAIVVAIYEHGESAAAVARLCNMRADHLRHRLRVLARRMRSAEFAMVATCRQQWPPKLRKVATACFLHGLTMRDASLQLGMTLHEVRRNRDVVRTMVEEWEARVRSRPLAGEARGKGG